MTRNFSTLSVNVIPYAATAILSLFIISTSIAQKQPSGILYKGNGTIAYTDKKGVETVLTQTAVDSVAVVYNNNILWVATNGNGSDQNSIIAWNIKKTNSINLVAPGMKANADYVVPENIVHFVVDKHTDRLFFSNYINSAKEYRTWVYDFATGRIQSFRDGLVKGVDDGGNITVVIYSADYVGPYKQQVIFSSNGALISTQEKSYESLSTTSH